MRFRTSLLLFIATLMFIFTIGCEKDEITPLVKDEQTKQESIVPENSTDKNKTKDYVHLSIQRVDDNGEKRFIISPTKVEIETKETFLSATVKILKQKGIQFEVTGSGKTAYMVAIDNLYEFDHGPTSGWIARKNGVQLKQSSGIEPVTNGDTVEWIYTTDYTKEKP